MASNLSIDARLDMLAFFNDPTVTPDSWEDFKAIYGNTYTRSEFNEGASLFYQASNHKEVKIPSILGYNQPNKPSSKRGPKKVEPKEDPIIEPEVKPIPKVRSTPLTKDSPKKGNTITIDGVVVGTESTFLPDKDFIKRHFDIFNEKYFDNQLSLKGVPISIKPIKGALAYVQSERWSHKVTKFEVSNLYKRSEKTFCSTIIHEMIHVWQHQVENSSGGHGWDFKEKMNEINRKSSSDGSIGWQVDTRETTEEANNRGEMNTDSPLARKIINNAYFMVGIYSRSDFCWLWKKDQVSRGLANFQMRYEKSHIYKVNKVIHLPTTRIATKWDIGNILGASISQKAIDEMIQNGEIVELDRQSVINGKPKPFKESIERDSGIIDVDDFMKTDDEHHRVLIDDNGNISDIYL